MIKHLRLSNFRRHADTEIFFDEGGQITLISGSNGAGKSTVIESIIYALYGEGRHGRSNIDQMIRRGAEIEGMEVELEFDVADTVYRVKRRRDNKLSSAVLWGNDVALVEGPREVTAAVSHLLGMDSRGFRLAVVAQQKELDGLASMRPGDRAQMLARLLRLDVVTQARDRARSIFRSERDALRGLGSVDSPEGLHEVIDEMAHQLAALIQERDASLAALAELDSKISASGDLDEAWRKANEQRARLEALVDGARSEVLRIEDELSRSVVDDSPLVLVDLEELGERVADVERMIAAAEANAKLSNQATMVSGELEIVVSRITELEAEKNGLTIGDLETTLAAVEQKRAELEALTHEREGLAANETRAQMTLRAAEHRLADLEGLQATCETCGQEISAQHREQQISSTTSVVSGAKSALDEARSALAELSSTIREATSAVTEAEKAHAATQRALERLEAIDGELFDLRRRQSTYQDQLARISVDVYDMDGLLAERGMLAIEVANAQAGHEAARLRELTIERRRMLEDSAVRAKERLGEAQDALEAGQIDSDLQERFATLLADRAAREIEAGLVADLSTQIAVGDEKLRGMRREVERLEQQRARRSGLEHQAQVASECATVLDVVGTRLNQQIRPALEGAVGELLSRLSDGRFDAVSLDADYNLSVRDDGAMRPLGEFSGGEIDLIALAMRLALASVVSERHGAGGAGFLILDECFGSQDQERRGSILTALRGLRGVYGQILLISHVGGIEDSADRVIEIVMDEETGIASAEVEA